MIVDISFLVSTLAVAIVTTVAVDRTWGTVGSYFNTPKAIFYLLKED